MKKPLIVLTGPTAVGKTDLSIKLAQRINGEIISADSMQVYKYMNIGTAKVTHDEMCCIPHHLIDVLSPDTDFNVSVFQKMAKEAISEIYDNGRIPIIVGGTGFYIQSVLYDIDFAEEESSNIRKELEKTAETEEGREELYNKLREVDPASCEKIHFNNIKKIIRALEFYYLNGKPISEHNETERQKESVYNSSYFVLTMDREKLYNRCDRRVDIMIEQGLVDEVRSLYDQGLLHKGSTASQGIGYKEITEYLDLSKGKSEEESQILLDNAIDTIKKNTRHYVKRQLTWFRRERDVIWIDKDEYKDDEQILEYMIEHLKTNGAIK